MAVKASANITLFHVVDIDSTTIYYLLQSSTANPPAKPTTDNPGGSWTTTEPTYTEGSTNTLYTVTKTKFSDGTFEYTPVSKSTAYEAAKTAYNKAVNANNNANTALETVNNLEIGGRNYILKSNTFTSGGSADSGTGSTSNTIHPSIENGLWKVVVDTPTNSNWNSWSHENIIEDNFKENDKFVFSFDIKSDNAINTTPPKIYFKNGMGYYNMTGMVSSEWSRVYYVGSWKDTNSIAFHLGWNGLQGTYYIRKLKFEDGNKVTDWTPAPEDIEEAPYIAGTQTANTRFWTGVANFSKLKSGQQITYLNPRSTIEETCGTGKLTGCAGRVDGSHTYAKGVEINSTNVYGEGTKNMVWLNLTLADGTTTNWIPCYYQANSRLTTHYNGGKLIRFTYIENANIAGTLYTGWFADGNYFENTYNRILYNNTIVSNPMYLNSGRLIATNDYGYVELSRNTKFRVDRPILYCGSAIGICSNGTNNYLAIGSLTLANNLSSPVFDDGNDIIETYVSSIGKTLYRGVGVTGTSTSNTKMTSSGITNAVVGDYYRNSSTGYMYRCTTAGNASTATWVYIAWQRNDKITGSSTTETVYSGSGISSAILGGFYMNSSTGNIFVCTLAGNASTAKWKYIGTTVKPAGKKWYSGTKITGVNETPTKFSGSGVSSAGVGDYYYNTGTGGYYECTLAGNASTAKWAYKGILIEAQQTLYLVGTLSGREFTVADIPFTTNPITPTDDSNDYYYIVIGVMYSLTAYYLVSEHPMFKHTNGDFKLLDDNVETIKLISSQISNIIMNEDSINSIVSDIQVGYWTYKLTTDSKFVANKEYFEYYDGHYTLIPYNSSTQKYTMHNGTQYAVNANIPASTIYEKDEFKKGFNETRDAFYQLQGTLETQTKDTITTWFANKIIGDGDDAANVEDTLNNLKTKAEELDDEIFGENGLNAYIRKGTETISGVEYPYVELGHVSSQLKLKLLPNDIGFYAAGQKVTWLSGDKLHVKESEIKNKEQVGHWVTYEDDQHNLNTKWVNEVIE